ncbi:hypothetical protein MYSTI_07094 [Myxococcus stipitatus DSM 14675]|uniref:Uncharacterized protein n=1 Tax=Myxococcus stipitatus (strain DSM 14675 / JCM 12634 / Mx s8) TaxID=1278073 RepID=L7UH98_MYXSD|nr:hypothetical protein [Myxococcus stipitatus]AGC48366.1 hypothetical protein MYSTI_07094 [Myxococcus stipitatus DSM 14675]
MNPDESTPTEGRAARPLLLAAVAVLALASGAVYVGTLKGGFLSASDVGGLPELAAIQAQLRPLDACALTYRRLDSKGKRPFPDSVIVHDCTGTGRVVAIKVPTTWEPQGVTFEMKRASPSEPFQVLIEKDTTLTPALQAAMEHFAPLIAAKLPEQQRAARAATAE